MRQTLRLLGAAAALFLLGAAPQPKAKTDFSLVIGNLVSQDDAPGNPCEPEEDLCWDVMLETRLSNVEVLAGNPTNQRLRVWHRAHVPYRRGKQLRLAMIVGPASEGIRMGLNFGPPSNDQVCINQAWFDSANQGMAIPRGHKVNADGNVCFDV